MRKPMKKNDLNFLLENKHYKRLHIFLYLISITLITLSYFLIIIIFSEQFHFVISVIFSLVIGLYIVMNRNRLVKIISDYIEEKKRKDYKKKSKENLKTTLRKITPKNKKLKLDIKGKVSLKDKAKNLKSKFKKEDKKKKKVGYIEIE